MGMSEVRQFVGDNVVNAVGRSPRQLRVEENDARLIATTLSAPHSPNADRRSINSFAACTLNAHSKASCENQSSMPRVPLLDENPYGALTMQLRHAHN